MPCFAWPNSQPEILEPCQQQDAIGRSIGAALAKVGARNHAADSEHVAPQERAAHLGSRRLRSAEGIRERPCQLPRQVGYASLP